MSKPEDTWKHIAELELAPIKSGDPSLEQCLATYPRVKQDFDALIEKLAFHLGLPTSVLNGYLESKVEK